MTFYPENIIDYFRISKPVLKIFKKFKKYWKTHGETDVKPFKNDTTKYKVMCKTILKYFLAYWQKHNKENLVFQGVFVNFSVIFQYFLKRVSSAQIPNKSIKLMTSESGNKWQKVKMRNFLLDYLCYRVSNKIMIYIDCNRI